MRPAPGLPVVLRIVYLRYVAASAVALGIDMSLFLAAIAAGMPPVPAAAVGYSAGVLAHWWLSSRAVFSDRLAAFRDARRRQQAMFLASALVGLAITVAVVGLGSRSGLDPRLAKIAAVALAFQATYLLRRRIVFA